jgi:hypothetical protein
VALEYVTSATLLVLDSLSVATGGVGLGYVPMPRTERLELLQDQYSKLATRCNAEAARLASWIVCLKTEPAKVQTCMATKP